jgi:hypothetical protein
MRDGRRPCRAKACAVPEKSGDGYGVVVDEVVVVVSPPVPVPVLL